MTLIGISEDDHRLFEEYLMGVVDSNPINKICFPPGQPGSERPVSLLTKLVEAYAICYPLRSDESAVILTSDAIAERWPCKKDTP